MKVLALAIVMLFVTVPAYADYPSTARAAITYVATLAEQVLMDGKIYSCQ